MNRDKQIEEMGEYIAEVITIECAHKACEDCKWLGSAKPEKADCTDYLIAEALYNAGYRKTSDIVREIFEEIEEVIAQSNEISDIRMRELAPFTYKVMREAGKLYYTAIIRAIAELKKKYIDKDTNVTTKTEEGK